MVGTGFAKPLPGQAGLPARPCARRRELPDHVQVPTTYHALTRGLSFKVGQGNVLTFTPPLTISETEFDRACAILDESIALASQEIRLS